MALKIVYKICCGIDVHKTFVVACIASTDSKGVTTYEHHRFSTYTKGLKDLLQWLLKHNCKDVCMESTGKYWIPVYNVLENDCSIVLAHPKYVKAIRGKKTDKKDAKWIADLFKHDLVAGSFMPPADIRQLRDLMRYRFKLTCFKSSEKNRLQKDVYKRQLESCGERLMGHKECFEIMGKDRNSYSKTDLEATFCLLYTSHSIHILPA